MLIVLSILLVYFAGLGLLPILLLPGIKEAPRAEQKPEQVAAIVLILGIAIDYGLVLLLRGLRVSFLAGGILSLAGIIWSGFLLRKRLLTLFSMKWFVWLAVLYLVLLFSREILLEPLAAWDARSIWFFHAKLIYYSQGLDIALPSGWNNPSLAFSHVDYPKLLPVLAARSAAAAGYWNEYVPKISLMILFIPALFAAVSFFDRMRISTLFLICALFLSLGWWLWNGYADGYFALFAVFACLFFVEWLKQVHFPDLLAGFAFLSAAVSLKNEGSLFALCVLCCLALLARKKITLSSIGKDRWRQAVLVLLPFLGFFLWSLQKVLWGLQNDLQLGAGSFRRAAERTMQGELYTILQSLLVGGQVMKALILLLVTFILAKAVRTKPGIFVSLPLITALLYFSGIFLVYAQTPQDLKWHLATSADRTMLPVLLCLFASTFHLLRLMEEPAVEKTDMPKSKAGQHKQKKLRPPAN